MDIQELIYAKSNETIEHRRGVLESSKLRKEGESWEEHIARINKLEEESNKKMESIINTVFAIFQSFDNRFYANKGREECNCLVIGVCICFPPVKEEKSHFCKIMCKENGQISDPMTVDEVNNYYTDLKANMQEINDLQISEELMDELSYLIDKFTFGRFDAYSSFVHNCTEYWISMQEPTIYI